MHPNCDPLVEYSKAWICISYGKGYESRTRNNIPGAKLGNFSTSPYKIRRGAAHDNYTPGSLKLGSYTPSSSNLTLSTLNLQTFILINPQALNPKPSTAAHPESAGWGPPQPGAAPGPSFFWGAILGLCMGTQG